MKLEDIAKNLANRINQEHYVLNELEKIAKTAYKLGFEEATKQAEAKQFVKHDVVGRSEQLHGEQCNNLSTACEKCYGEYLEYKTGKK